MTAVISVCILKKNIKASEFLCSHFNIEDGRNTQYLYLKKSKNATEMQKKNIYTVYGEGAVTDQMCQKWFEKFHVEDFSLEDAPWSGRPVEVDSDQMEILIEKNQHFTTWKRADILRISKSIKLLVKQICVSFFVEKKLKRLFWPTQYFTFHLLHDPCVYNLASVPIVSFEICSSAA